MDFLSPNEFPSGVAGKGQEPRPVITFHGDVAHQTATSCFCRVPAIPEERRIRRNLLNRPTKIPRSRAVMVNVRPGVLSMISVLGGIPVVEQLLHDPICDERRN